ncbi:hypothetical protein KJ975_00825 [Myxococcota bacterium]|nr:hypothetical protein [Myxococcota bacterium]
MLIWWICCALLAGGTVPENRVTFAVEVRPLPGTVWRPADYLLLGAVTLFSILTYGFFIMAASDD